MTSTDESIGGWREHPDFSTYSDARLDQAQRLIDENIRWAKQAGDPTLETYNEQEMRMLQAERGRRQGGQNALLVPKGDIGKAKHFNPVSAAELLSRVTAVIPYLLAGFIARGTLNLLIAYMKTGKSTLVYRLIICIAQGLDFLERKTDRGAVLILAVEEHVRDVERRLKRFGLREDDPVYVHVGTVQEQSETLKTIKNFVIEKKIVLVVIDSLSRFWNVMHENNNMEVIREVSPLLEMARETDAAVLLVHHERKSGGDDGRSIRGGSALFGLVDQAIFLERRPGESIQQAHLKDAWPI